MQTIDPQTTVGELVRSNTNCARVFEAYEIDYCCGGKISLGEACRRRGVDQEEVLNKLAESDAVADDTTALDPNAMSLTELADHIERTHHEFLRSELPRLERMTEKVARVHGARNPKLRTVRAAFVALKAELEPHMMKEERILFPMVRELEVASSRPEFHCGTVANPIGQMEHEHDQAGHLLAELRESTDGFTPPEWACNTYRTMLDSLARLESDMHQHVHKENNVLFPKAVELEATLS